LIAFEAFLREYFIGVFHEYLMEFFGNNSLIVLRTSSRNTIEDYRYHVYTLLYYIELTWGACDIREEFQEILNGKARW